MSFEFVVSKRHIPLLFFQFRFVVAKLKVCSRQLLLFNSETHHPYLEHTRGTEPWRVDPWVQRWRSVVCGYELCFSLERHIPLSSRWRDLRRLLASADAPRTNNTLLTRGNIVSRKDSGGSFAGTLHCQNHSHKVLDPQNH